MFIMIRPNRKVPLEHLLWGTNKRLQPKGLSTNNSREQNTKQECTETNQQQPTDITQQNHKRTWTTRTPDELEVNSGGSEE
jgi:hypothetical protein